ncbi:MAG: prepilin-type N-terminal cleavage/methylation domain-containing protein [Oscillospiraceae bacterium]|nr:prepilin-type N-terminal cleavage/methylation domain-containing protein [Oscillospiraceae bacterium]
MNRIFRKRNKKLKGMTLIECIIAMAVFSIATLIMVRMTQVAMELLRNSNHVNNKVAAEAPAAAVQDVTTLYDDQGIAAPVAAPPEAVTFTVKSSVGNYTVNAKKYDTSCMASRSNRDTGSGLDADLDFYTIEPATAPGP